MNELKNYVAQARAMGTSDEKIQSDLSGQGWSASDIQQAISVHPAAIVPAGIDSHQDADRAYWHGALTSIASFFLFVIVSSALVSLVFDIINKHFPVNTDSIFSLYSSYASNSWLHYEMASLLISFPLYILVLIYRQRMFGSSEVKEPRFSSWVTYLVLVLNSAWVLGDLIAVVYYWLEGGADFPFMLKAITILGVAALVYGFYFFERQTIYYKKSLGKIPFWIIGGITCVLVAWAVVQGFIIAGTPGQAKIFKADMFKVDKVSGFSTAIKSYVAYESKLPNSLSDVKEKSYSSYSFSGLSDEELAKNYDYSVKSPNEYQLCVVFEGSTLKEDKNSQDYYNYGTSRDKWTKHDKGKVCNDFTVSLPGNSISPYDF